MFPKALLKNGAARIGSLAKGQPAAIHVSPLLSDAAEKDTDEVLRGLETSSSGLTQIEAAERLERYGPNEVAREKQRGWLVRLLLAMRNPLVILLSVLAVVTYCVADSRADEASAGVMALMVVLGVTLRFVQESRADSAAAKLKAMITVTATVVRDGQPREIPLHELVPGDLVKLSAGDMIPADVRVSSSKDLFIIQASLTGESMPVEKIDARVKAERPFALGIGESVFSGHERRERHGDRRRRGHRVADVLWEHGAKHCGSRNQDQLRPRGRQVHVADDHADGDHVAAGVPHQ